PQRGVLADARQYIETVGAGQVHVQQDHVGQVRGSERRDDLLAVARDARLVTLELQQHPYRSAELKVVLDQEHRIFRAVVRRFLGGRLLRDADVVTAE